MTTTPAPTPAIEASGLTRRFGDIVAVDGVDLHVGAGKVLGLLGPDGAGKSTLIRMLATVLRPDAGDVAIQGFSVTRQAGKVTPRIGYMSQKFALYPDLSVAENIEFFARLRGVPPGERKDRSRELLTGMGLIDFVDRQAGRLSGGMKQKLFLATTLMHRPQVLLLDEP
ncbi:MAG: ABC transporter ATP-binding protein, partial [Micropruina sp.]|nr:ABC transporter ATP-binding protein [Micropruina sp.]